MIAPPLSNRLVRRERLSVFDSGVGVTEEEIARIEAALDIRLPAEYRKAVVPFPIPAYVGNTETELWDDAAALVELNRELRTGGRIVQPWPENLFALGRDDGGSATAIDLREPTPPVWWADRCHLDVPGSGRVADSFDMWVADYVGGLRSDLDIDGIDPNGTPESRSAARRPSLLGCLLLIVVLAVIGVAIEIAYVYFFG